MKRREFIRAGISGAFAGTLAALVWPGRGCRELESSIKRGLAEKMQGPFYSCDLGGNEGTATLVTFYRNDNGVLLIDKIEQKPYEIKLSKKESDFTTK